MKRKPTRQLSFGFRTWGGAREGAGRKPNGLRAGASHLKRPPLSAEHPVHVTLRVAPTVPNLRHRRAFVAARAALSAGRERLGGRLVHFSVQRNHVHLIVEASDRRALSQFVQGLSVRLARALNRAHRRVGRVFGDRYHAHALKTPLEVKRAISYVLGNFRKHAGERGSGLVGVMDGCSSALWFDGWTLSDAAERAIGIARERSLAGVPVVPPRTWLLRVGYKRHGLVDPNAAPAPSERS